MSELSEQVEYIQEVFSQGVIDAAASEQMKQDAAVGKAIREYLDDNGAYESEIAIRKYAGDDYDQISVKTSVDDEPTITTNGETIRAALAAADLLPKEQSGT